MLLVFRLCLRSLSASYCAFDQKKSYHNKCYRQDLLEIYCCRMDASFLCGQYGGNMLTNMVSLCPEQILPAHAVYSRFVAKQICKRILNPAELCQRVGPWTDVESGRDMPAG